MDILHVFTQCTTRLTALDSRVGWRGARIVETHVARMLGELGLQSRTAADAVREGLV